MMNDNSRIQNKNCFCGEDFLSLEFSLNFTKLLEEKYTSNNETSIFSNIFPHSSAFLMNALSATLKRC